MTKTHQAITLDGELLQALDEFVASRPRSEHARAMEAALLEKMSRLARMLLAHAGETRPNWSDTNGEQPIPNQLP